MPAVPPKKLNNRHRVLMRLLITGLPLGQAALALGFTVSRASIISNSSLFKAEMERMRGEIEGELVSVEGDIGSRVRGVLEKEGVTSAEKLVTLRDNAVSEGVSLRAAQDILDRLGIKGKDVLEIQEKVVGSDALQSMLATAVKEMQDAKKT